MKKLEIYSLLLCLLCFLLSACASMTYPDKIEAKGTKNLEYNAVLTDPEIKKPFKAMKAVAQQARVQNKFANPTLDPQSIQKLNSINSQLMSRLQYHYHLTPNKHKIRTSIATNNPDVCYHYYNTYDTNAVGKTCNELSNCDQCKTMVSSIRYPGPRIVHSKWWDNKTTTALVDIIKLSNGETVYFTLELSPNN